MKRIALIFALLALAEAAHATPTLVAQCSVSAGNTSVGCTLTVPAGATLIYATCAAETDPTSVYFQDTLNNGWLREYDMPGGSNIGASAIGFAVFSTEGSPLNTGVDTISVTSESPCSFSEGTLVVSVYSGTLVNLSTTCFLTPSDATCPWDGFIANDVDGQDPGSLTPTQAGDLFIASYTNLQPPLTSDTCSAISTGTIVNNYADGTNSEVADAYYVNSGTDAVDMIWTCPNGDNGEAMMGAFKAGVAQATAPSCTPTSGVVPQTVTCTNPNSGTTDMCYTTNGATPATDGTGTGCTTGTEYTTTISVSVAETLKIIAGTSIAADSSVVSYTYTSASAVRHRAEVIQR